MDARCQCPTLYDPVQAHPQDLLGEGKEKRGITRRDAPSSASTGGSITRQDPAYHNAPSPGGIVIASSVPVSQGSPAGITRDGASRKSRDTSKYAVRDGRVQGKGKRPGMGRIPGLLTTLP
jgi:hypothetical protein